MVLTPVSDRVDISNIHHRILRCKKSTRASPEFGADGIHVFPRSTIIHKVMTILHEVSFREFFWISSFTHRRSFCSKCWSHG